MPKPLSREQLTELQANGVVVPGQESPEVVMPAGLVLRTLGQVGLPHAEIVDQMEDPAAPDITVMEGASSEVLKERCLRAHQATVRIMDLIGEPMPFLEDDAEFYKMRVGIKQTFETYERLGLEPDVALTPTGRPVEFWADLFAKVQVSLLNPYQAGSSDKVLRNGGLYLTDKVKTNWTSLVVRPGADSGWKLEVISGKNKPEIMNVTSYGYADEENLVPNKELAQLLGHFNLPDILDRSNMAQTKIPIPPLIQPNIHPYIDTYAMNQLTRIIQGKDPVDIDTYSWLRGELTSGYVPTGDWNPSRGRVYLNWDNANNLRHLGVRPSGKG